MSAKLAQSPRVRVISVHPHGFRNLAAARIELSESITVVHGPNAAGKTNLLEAVYFGLIGRSCRAAGGDRDVIAFSDQVARVEVELADGGDRVLLATAISRHGERRREREGPPAQGPDEGRPPVSVFLPDRLQLVKGPPAHRRAHVDRLVGALWPSRADLRLRFGRVLGQRNALVARIRAGLASPDALPTWDRRLADCAEPLIAARAEAIELLREPFATVAAELGLKPVELAYRPAAHPNAAEIAAELDRRRAAGFGRSYGGYGPQMDDLRLALAGRALRRYGSQGQQRIALLALQFAERRALIDAGRPTPLMLLDDVMSELDAGRRDLLIARLAESGQALITTTELGHVPRRPECKPLAVRDGRVTALAAAA